MRVNIVSVALAAIGLLSQQAYAQEYCDTPGRFGCPQNCGIGADKLCVLPGNFCECTPY
ncbi:hypothetical protein CSOJ01_12518 [Colletotrichum sojae]|uniref:Uncharacterized protein n=1 Tax=Colletotrichum sojae TaxID=2175907 RepID=A0A8H6IUM3_9PEZI|nr:hypothetical protein CSOJ01_12518 [Colletotrichum sojae]